MSRIKLEDKLAVNKYEIDRDVHIEIKEDICNKCTSHACVYICPAGCYKLSDLRVTFSYEGCLECGSCVIACDNGAVIWKLPRAGLGISYQYG